jgi:hypothetical protein
VPANVSAQTRWRLPALPPLLVGDHALRTATMPVRHPRYYRVRRQYAATARRAPVAFLNVTATVTSRKLPSDTARASVTFTHQLLPPTVLERGRTSPQR